MNIFINDEPHETREGTILIDLLEEYGLDDFKGWAIAKSNCCFRNKLKVVLQRETQAHTGNPRRMRNC